MTDRLKAYLDNELTPAERTEIEAALDSNPALQTELDEIKATTTYLETSAKPIEITGLEATLSALKPKKMKSPFYRSPYAILAACTVIAAIIITPRPMGTRYVAAEMPAPTSAPADSADIASRTKYASGMAENYETAEMPASSAPYAGEVNAEPPNVSAANRLIIKTGDISLRVKSLETTLPKVESLAKKYGGFVESSSRSSGYQVKNAYLTIRIDASKYDTSFNDLRSLGDVISESTSGQDVTTQVADNEARLRQMRLEEQQYEEILKKTTKVSDILQVRKYLSEVRQNIESIEAQLKSLKSLASLSTITVNLEQREQVATAPRRDWLSNTWVQALSRLNSLGRTVVSFAINLLVLAPFWLPIAAGIWWFTRRKANSNRQ